MRFVSGPTDIAFDGEGRMLIAEALNFRIRRVDTEGVITTIAGIGYSNYRISQFVGQPAISSPIERVKRLFPQSSGEILFTTGTWGVWAIDTDGLIQRKNQSGGGTVIDMLPQGRVFYGRERLVRELFADGTYERFAGASRSGPWGDGGVATDASIWSTDDVAADSLGNVYIPDDLMNKIRVVAPDGTIDTFAGDPESSSAGDGGPAILANLYNPDLIEVGPAFDVYLGYHLGLRHIDPQGTIVTWPSTYNPCRSTTGCPGDGQPVEQGWLREPDDMVVDGAGNLFILLEMRALDGSDYQWIRIVSPDGILDSLRLSDGLLWNRCTQCNDGKAYAMAVDQNDELLVALPDRIIRLTPGGTVEDVPGTVGAFANPVSSMAVDDSGSIYAWSYSDAGMLKRITPAGVINTLAPRRITGVIDGEGVPLRSAGLFQGYGSDLAMDAGGNLLIAENLWVRKVHSVADCDVNIEASTSFIDTRIVEGDEAEDLEFTLSSTDGPLSYSLDVDQDWVSFSPPVSDPSGMSDTITVSLDPAGLELGFNYAVVKATPSDGSMAVPIAVGLTILMDDPQMGVSVNELDFAPSGGANPAPQSFTVHNPGSGPLNYRIRPDQDWVTGSPDVGTSFGELDSIEISVDAGGLGEGVHNATVEVEQVDGDLLETIDVTLTVAPGSLTDLAATAMTGPPAAQMGQTIDYAATITNEGLSTGGHVSNRDLSVGGRYDFSDGPVARLL